METCKNWDSVLGLVLRLGKLQQQKCIICPRCNLFCNTFWQIISDNLDAFYTVDRLINSEWGQQSQMINTLAYRILGQTKHPGRVFMFLTYLFRAGFHGKKIAVCKLNLDKIYPWGQFYQDVY